MASAARTSGRVDAVLLAGCIVLSLIAVGLRAEQTEPIASALRRTVVAPLVSLQQGAERWRSAWTTSEASEIRLDSLALVGIRSKALDIENRQLRTLMGLGSRLEWGFVPAEALHSTAPIPSEDLVTTITLTAGTNAGIKKYNPVVASEGLVGQIQSADPTTSIAILYSHPDFRASAMTADGAAFGIAYPHPTSGRNSAEPYLLELRGVPARDTIPPGTLIYTAGLGGVFPRGVKVGTVMSQIKTSELWTNTYLVRPAVNPGHLTSVFVLTPQRVTEGTGNVWASGSSPDATIKRIVGAGDSLARQAAVIEAAARRATLDSVRKATVDSIRRVLGMPDTAKVAPGAAATPAVGAKVAPGAAATPAAGAKVDSAARRRDSLKADSIRRAARPPVKP